LGEESEGEMANKRWGELSPWTRRLLAAGVAVEGGLKIAVLADLRKRPAAEVKGPKLAWAAAMLLNTFGVLPAVYLLYGRKTSV
jgi:hypothetical protein